MAKGKKIKRKPWTMQSLKRLQEYSEKGTPIRVISKELERTVGALRQQAFRMGIPIGERSNSPKTLLSRSRGRRRPPQTIAAVSEYVHSIAQARR
jgi:hypothetical protein